MQRYRRLIARMVFRPSLFLVPALLVALGSAEAKGAGAAKPLSLYEAALRALDADQMQRFHALADRLEAFPLYPYLLYAELRHRIESASSAEVTSFLERYAELPVAPMLRTAWLRELARRQNWRAFLTVYQGNQNVYLRCALVQAKLALGDKAQAIAAAKPLWQVGYRQPQSCHVAFDLLDQAGVLTPERVKERILLALAAGHDRLAADLLDRLPPAERSQAAHWLKVFHQPQTALQKPPEGPDEAVARVLTAALGHLAHDQPAKAHQLWSKLEARYAWAATMTSPIARIIALWAAYHALPKAGEWLQALPEAQTTSRVRAWRVRSALRWGNWKAVARAVKAMAPEQRNAEVWRYWRARALEELGQAEHAERLYRTIADEFSYYGFLAADALGTPYYWGDAMPSTDPARKRKLRQQSAARRALLLYQAEQHKLAQLEWRALIRRLSVRDRLAAARVAADQDWPWATLYAAVMGGVNNASFLRFPKGYLGAVRRTARQTGIDPAWLLALIRQESTFRSSVCSHAGACGVMQLMPATARWVLKRNGKDTSELIRTISNPARNIAIGANYLDYLRGRFSSLILALAAYNAGPGNVTEWLNITGSPPPGSARWIETLLFGETRRFLQAVIFNQVVYRLRFNAHTIRISELLQAEQRQYARVAMENLGGEQR